MGRVHQAGFDRWTEQPRDLSRLAGLCLSAERPTDTELAGGRSYSFQLLREIAHDEEVLDSIVTRGEGADSRGRPPGRK